MSKWERPRVREADFAREAMKITPPPLSHLASLLKLASFASERGQFASLTLFPVI